MKNKINPVLSCIIALVALTTAPALQAETIYGVTVFRELITFDSANPSTITSSVTITGLVDQFEGVRRIDFRLTTGELYLLGNAPGGIYHLYKVNTTTGVATQIGGNIDPPSGGSFGFNFESTADQIRVVTDAGVNRLYNPTSGTSATYTPVHYASGDPGAGGPPPAIVSCSVTANVILHDIDAARGTLVTQNYNDGTLHTVGPLNIPPSSYIDGVNLEISPTSGIAYLAMSDPGGAPPHARLYTVNLNTGAATLVGTIGDGNTVLNSMSISPAAPANADLKVTVSDSPDPVQNNGDVTYRFFVSNNGPDTAKGVQARVSAQNATFVSTSRASVHSSQGEYTIDLPDIPANGTLIDFTVVFSAHQPAADPSAFVTLAYSVFSSGNDSIRSNDTGTTTTGFAAPPPAPPPGELGTTRFFVNERDSVTPGLADTVLRFSAYLPAGHPPSGTTVKFQQSRDNVNWTSLSVGGDNLGDLAFIGQNVHQLLAIEGTTYALSTTGYFHSANVYFRAVASAPGVKGVSISNVIGPFDLASSTKELGTTTMIVNGGFNPTRVTPGQRLNFVAVQRAGAPGLQLRVQTSTNPRDESSWSDLPSGIMTTNCEKPFDRVCSNGATASYHARTNSYPTGSGVYFRAISSAPGYLDSLSNWVGPFGLIHDELPVVTITSSTAARSVADGSTADPLVLHVDASDSDGQVAKVVLYVNGEPKFIDTQAPYDFDLRSLAGGVYTIVAIAYDNIGGIGASHVIGRFRVASDSFFREFVRTKSGDWGDAGAWSPQGVPGPDDSAVIAGFAVNLNGDITVRDLYVGTGENGLDGNLTGGATGHVTVKRFFTLGHQGSLDHLIVDVLSGAEFDVLEGTQYVGTTTIVNSGTIKLFGDGFNSTTSHIQNYGLVTFSDYLRNTVEGNAQLAKLGDLTQFGGKVDFAGGRVGLNSFSMNSGEFAMGHLLSDAGGGLIGQDGATLIGQDGATLIGQDGATLIGNDGAGLLSDAGIGLVGNDGSSIVGQNGASITNQRAVRGKNGPAASTSAPFITITGGTVTGYGRINGNVQNNAGYLNVGNSPGVLTITGDYTQGASASLLLDYAGTNGLQTDYDLLNIGGIANLGGTLHIRQASGANPGSAAIVPLAYSSVSGNFSSVSSNAQLTFNPTGIVTSVDASKPAPTSGQPLNISTRMRIETGENVLIAGFIITGPSGSTKKVLIRGIGPSLAQFGVPGTISDPKLELHTSSVTIENDNWSSLPNKNEIPVGFEPSDPKESAIVATLSPGSYTAVVKGAHDTETGVGLAEVYDLETGSAAKLANISTRGFVGKDDNVMIGGFIVGGTEPAKVLVRATGPTLATFGVKGALADPTLELHDSNGANIGNDNWRSTQESQVIATTIPPANDLEPAVLSTLAPGNYTAVVRGKNNTTGVAVVEAYNLQ